MDASALRDLSNCHNNSNSLFVVVSYRLAPALLQVRNLHNAFVILPQLPAFLSTFARRDGMKYSPHSTIITGSKGRSLQLLSCCSLCLLDWQYVPQKSQIFLITVEKPVPF
jgi:hypothetical protein